MLRLHAIVGVIFVAVFVLTGAYMRQELPPPAEDNGVMRMIFRSTHVYILLGALPNFVLAAFYAERSPRPSSLITRFASCCVAIAPLIFTWAFFSEPAPDRWDRPISLLGVIVALTGTLAFAVSSRLDGEQKRDASDP